MMKIARMKFSRFFACLLAVLAGSAWLSAQEPAVKQHRVVVEVTATGLEQWNAALSGVENLLQALGPRNTEVEIVAHADGINLLLARDNTLAERMARLKSDGVIFAACQNSMRSHHLAAADLLPLSTPVDAGVAEVVRKQEAGWSFLKYGN